MQYTYYHYVTVKQAFTLKVIYEMTLNTRKIDYKCNAINKEPYKLKLY